MKLKDLFESTGKSVADLGIEYESGYFNCTSELLTSLKGSPSHVLGDFHCSFNKLKSLEGAPARVDGKFYCTNNDLTSLKDVGKYIKEIHGFFNAGSNRIKSHVLGLLLIKGITRIYLDHEQAQDILNKHLGNGRAGMLQAQEELIEAGLEEFAQL